MSKNQSELDKFMAGYDKVVDEEFRVGARGILKKARLEITLLGGRLLADPKASRVTIQEEFKRAAEGIEASFADVDQLLGVDTKG